MLKVDNVEVLYLQWHFCPQGTLAFLEDEESLLLKVNAGWQYVSVWIVIVVHAECCIATVTR